MTASRISPGRIEALFSYRLLYKSRKDVYTWTSTRLSSVAPIALIAVGLMYRLDWTPVAPPAGHKPHLGWSAGVVLTLAIRKTFTLREGREFCAVIVVRPLLIDSSRIEKWNIQQPSTSIGPEITSPEITFVDITNRYYILCTALLGF